MLLGFTGASDGKETACNAGGLGSIPGLGRGPEGGYGNPPQYSCLENPHGQRSLLGYTHEIAESDTTEQLSMQVLNKQLKKFGDFSNNYQDHMSYEQIV